MKIVGFRAGIKKEGRIEKWGGLFGFQATANAGCSECCRVGSWVPMFLPSSPHSLPEEFDPPDLPEYVWVHPPHWRTITVHCNRKRLWEQILLPRISPVNGRGILGCKATCSAADNMLMLVDISINWTFSGLPAVFAWMRCFRLSRAIAAWDCH